MGDTNYGSLQKKQKNEQAGTGQRDKGREFFSSQHAKYDRMTRDYAQTYGMGASGPTNDESCSPVDPSRMPRVTDWPGSEGHTDVQTRDCASFKDNGLLGGSQ